MKNSWYEQRKIDNSQKLYENLTKKLLNQNYNILQEASTATKVLETLKTASDIDKAAITAFRAEIKAAESVGVPTEKSLAKALSRFDDAKLEEFLTKYKKALDANDGDELARLRKEAGGKPKTPAPTPAPTIVSAAGEMEKLAESLKGPCTTKAQEIVESLNKRNVDPLSTQYGEEFENAMLAYINQRIGSTKATKEDLRSSFAYVYSELPAPAYEKFKVLLKKGGSSIISSKSWKRIALVLSTALATWLGAKAIGMGVDRMVAYFNYLINSFSKNKCATLLAKYQLNDPQDVDEKSAYSECKLILVEILDYSRDQGDEELAAVKNRLRAAGINQETLNFLSQGGVPQEGAPQGQKSAKEKESSEPVTVSNAEVGTKGTYTSSKGDKFRVTKTDKGWKLNHNGNIITADKIDRITIP